MRKFVLPLLFCLVAAVSCELEDSFYIENAQDIVIAKENNYMVNDYNIAYSITQDQSDAKWSVGQRLFITFDVQNQNYDIILKDYEVVQICQPTEKTGELEMRDPVKVVAHSVSAGYINLCIDYTRLPGSDFLHVISMQYTDNPTSGRLDFYLLHDGNGENKLKMPDAELETVRKFYSFPIANLVEKGKSRQLYITIQEIVGSEVKEANYSLYDAPILF